MTKAIILNKYRNELGRTYRKQYDNGLRTRWCNRSNMRSCQCRPNSKCGVVLTTIQDNLILEMYEKYE